jgi:hypothetical protein
MVDLVHPTTIFLAQAWESDEAFGRHVQADYHRRRVREIVQMDFRQLEKFEFAAASCRHGVGSGPYGPLNAKGDRHQS